MIEYRIRPVTRYIVTRYDEDPVTRNCASSIAGEFPNQQLALDCANAFNEWQKHRVSVKWDPEVGQPICQPVGPT